MCLCQIWGADDLFRFVHLTAVCLCFRCCDFANGVLLLSKQGIFLKIRFLSFHIPKNISPTAFVFLFVQGRKSGTQGRLCYLFKCSKALTAGNPHIHLCLVGRIC